MTDSELIMQVASIWVSGGGDAEGFMYFVTKIRDTIKKLKEIEDTIQEK